MNSSWNAASARSTVRGVALTRYAVVSPPNGKTSKYPLDFAVFSAIGRPRLWSETLQVAASSFERQSVSDLTSRTFAVQRQLARWAGSLLESEKPDVATTAVRISHTQEDVGQVDIVSAGPGRVYLYRGGEPVRLSPREEPKAGLLREKPTVAQASLGSGDVLLLGSVSAFSVRSMAHVASTIHEDPDAPVSTLVQLLVGPTERNGVGASAVAIQVVF